MIRVPPLPLIGGCACGAVRYEVTGQPIAVYACCCADCQTLSGSAFSLAMPVFRKDLRIVQGETAVWTRTADSGRRIPQHRCAACGTRLFTEPPYGPETVTLRPGTLDDASWVVPVAAYWTKSAQAWVGFPEGALTYETQPDDFMPIVRAWRARTQS